MDGTFLKLEASENCHRSHNSLELRKQNKTNKKQLNLRLAWKTRFFFSLDLNLFVHLY